MTTANNMYKSLLNQTGPPSFMPIINIFYVNINKMKIGIIYYDVTENY